MSSRESLNAMQKIYFLLTRKSFFIKPSYPNIFNDTRLSFFIHKIYFHQPSNSVKRKPMVNKWKKSNELALRLGNTRLCQGDNAESMTVYRHRAGHCLHAPPENRSI